MAWLSASLMAAWRAVRSISFLPINSHSDRLNWNDTGLRGINDRLARIWSTFELIQPKRFEASETLALLHTDGAYTEALLRTKAALARSGSAAKL